MPRTRETVPDEASDRTYDSEPPFTRLGSEEASARNKPESSPERAYPERPGR